MKREILIGLSLFLGGCTLFPPEREAPPLYILKGGRLEQAASLKAPLTVYLPTSEASLDTHRIAVTVLPYHREYIENGEWPEHLPKIVQEALLEALGQRWGGATVQRTEAQLQTEYGLFSDIQDFSVYPLEGGRAEVRLKINFQFVDCSKKRVIAAKSFSEVIALRGFRVTETVAAFNQGFHKISQKVVNWIENIKLPEKVKETLANDKR